VGALAVSQIVYDQAKRRETLVNRFGFFQRVARSARFGNLFTTR
jgi:hypothetical protein